jgi:GLPGLI family protein
MKSKNLKMFKYLFIISLLVAQTAKAQQDISSSDSLKGLVIYRQEINMSSTAINRDTLKFNRTKSIFQWNLYSTSGEGLRKAKKDYPTAKVVKSSSITDSKGQITLFDTTKDSLYTRMNMHRINKLLYLKEQAPALEWIISDSTKMVGNYTTKKATAHFRGRNYIAWFTPEIPVPYGPWKLHGLPGLILQAYDQTGNIYFSATDISLKEVGPIGPISMSGNEEIISLAEYKEITKNFKRYRKRSVLKKVRPHISKEDFAKMKVELPDLEIMETFEDSTDQ